MTFRSSRSLFYDDMTWTTSMTMLYDRCSVGIGERARGQRAQLLAPFERAPQSNIAGQCYWHVGKAFPDASHPCT